LLAVLGDRSEGTATWPGSEETRERRTTLPPGAPLFGTLSGEGVQLLRLRAKVRQFWIDGVLEASLASSLPGPPRTLEHALVAGLGHQLEAPPPAEVSMAQSTAEVFEHNGRSLLIVGSAGSGKTTQLLLVARQLMEEGAEEVPVVLTLSAWKGERRDLDAWLSSELRTKYQVPTILSSAWLRRGLILPLLDGLDEVPARHRAGAIRAINRAIELGRLPGLLVTSRSKEYLDEGSSLGLSVAMRLHPLSPTTVDELRDTVTPLSRLTPGQWGNLRPLLDSPLALSLLSSALGSGPLALATTPRGTAQLGDLLDVYIERMIRRSGKSRLPCEPAELLEFLAQLGHEMSENQTDIFAPDGVQPSWLSSARAKLAYALLSRWIGAGIYASTLILSCGFTPLYNAGLHVGLKFGCVMAGLTTLTVGTVHGAYAAYRLISGQEEPLATWQHRLRVAILGLVSAALNAALLGSWAGHPIAAVLAAEAALLAAPLMSPHNEVGFPSGDIRLIDRLRFSVAKALRSAIFGICFGIIAAMIAMNAVAGDRGTAKMVVILYLTSLWFLFGGLRGRQVSTSARPYGCVIHSFQWSVMLGVIAIPLAALPTSLVYGPTYGFYLGLTTGVVLWLWYGGMGLLQYSVLRLMLSLQGSRLFRTKYLEAAADRALLHRVGSGYLFVHPMLRANLARRWGARRSK
jgi:hypothetical protein